MMLKSLYCSNDGLDGFYQHRNPDKIPSLAWELKCSMGGREALHGYANNDSVTMFPEPIGMAASFDDSLVIEKPKIIPGNVAVVFKILKE